MQHVLQPIPRTAGLQDPDWWYWCPSLAQAPDGRWHLFASRWPRSLPFHPTWLLASEVVRAVADHPEGPYRVEEVVLGARGPGWWDGRMAHNPRVLHDGRRWLMFYTGSTHPFAQPTAGENILYEDPRVIVARSRKRIGLAVADRLEGPWRRPDTPLLDTRPGHFDDFLTSNPSPCLLEDGSLFLVYKARGWSGTAARPTFGPMVLGAATAPVAEGPWTRVTEGPLLPPSLGEVEDPFVWRSARGFELMAKDMSGRLCGVEFGGVRAWSPDGRDWRLDSQPLVHDRTIRWSDGEVQRMGALERASYLIRDGRPTHLVAAIADGVDGFIGASRTWNVVVPLDARSETLAYA